MARQGGDPGRRKTCHSRLFVRGRTRPTCHLLFGTRGDGESRQCVPACCTEPIRLFRHRVTRMQRLRNDCTQTPRTPCRGAATHAGVRDVSSLRRGRRQRRRDRRPVVYPDVQKRLLLGTRQKDPTGRSRPSLPPTAARRNSSLNLRRCRLGFVLLPIMDIVSAFRNVPTRSDQAHPKRTSCHDP